MEQTTAIIPALQLACLGGAEAHWQNSVGNQHLRPRKADNSNCLFGHSPVYVCSRKLKSGGVLRLQRPVSTNYTPRQAASICQGGPCVARPQKSATVRTDEVLQRDANLILNALLRVASRLRHARWRIGLPLMSLRWSMNSCDVRSGRSAK